MKQLILIGAIIIMFAHNLRVTPAEFLDPEQIPDRFGSVAELKAKVYVDDGAWKTYVVNGTEFLVGRTTLPSAGVSKERIACWRINASRSEILCVWSVRLTGVGVVELKYDQMNFRLDAVPKSNTPLKGKTVASVILSAL